MVQLTPGCNGSLLIGAIRKSIGIMLTLTFYGISIIIIPLLVLKIPTHSNVLHEFTMLLILICMTIVFPLSADCVNTLSIGLQGACPT